MKRFISNVKNSLKWAFFPSTIIAMLSASTPNGAEITIYTLYTFLFLIALFSIAFLGFHAIADSGSTIKENKNEYEEAKNEYKALQENIEEDFFNKLIKIKFKHIDQYYY
ncbi:hypothetical protein [Hymenobacter cavernae]|uniref:Uncharacterized protein n=1 Tax=Hymenobacter cavernae TaxID=2044852 RepID=A0ABQ1UJZ6_9BACT|nr:hypothetical protein [Hymenobacter cavernae]GGF18913.1 hypothetical protein GCM10011383_33020 [Hymenobacter cavernae]